MAPHHWNGKILQHFCTYCNFRRPKISSCLISFFFDLSLMSNVNESGCRCFRFSALVEQKKYGPPASVTQKFVFCFHYSFVRWDSDWCFDHFETIHSGKIFPFSCRLYLENLWTWHVQQFTAQSQSPVVHNLLIQIKCYCVSTNT